MSGAMRDDNALRGLPKLIYDTLKAHPEWEYNEQDKVACAGPGCEWVKPRNHTTTHGFLQHQTWVLRAAIGDAGYRKDAQ